MFCRTALCSFDHYTFSQSPKRAREANIALPQCGPTVIFSKQSRYQSSVIGMTIYLSACAFRYALSAQACLVLSIKFTFFNQQHHRADTASNTQTAAMLGVSRNNNGQLNTNIRISGSEY